MFEYPAWILAINSQQTTKIRFERVTNDWSGAPVFSVQHSVCRLCSGVRRVRLFTRLGQVHCSLSAFLLGFHVHEKALLVPAVVSSLVALESRDGARMHLRLNFLAAFAVLPLLPGPDLAVLKVTSIAMRLRDPRW